MTGVYEMTCAALPLMLDDGSGHIVNVSSIAGKGAEANRTAYCAAKWGLQGFSLALRAELTGTEVRVHVRQPVESAMTRISTRFHSQADRHLRRCLPMLGAGFAR